MSEFNGIAFDNIATFLDMIQHALEGMDLPELSFVVESVYVRYNLDCILGNLHHLNYYVNKLMGNLLLSSTKVLFKTINDSYIFHKMHVFRTIVKVAAAATFISGRLK